MSKSMVYSLSRRLALFSQAFSKGILILLRLYQLLISPHLGQNCRFYPSCSDYAMKAIQNFGVFKGVMLTLKRLARCHPGHPGGIDQVPSSS